MREWVMIGVPSSAGAHHAGQERAPAALRSAGLAGRLRAAGLSVADAGDLPGAAFAVDHEHPAARNLAAVARVARQVADAVADVVAGGRLPLVAGGDCTITLGVIAGFRRAHPDVGLLYVDGDADLGTPQSGGSGILDSMGIAHLLGYGAPELTGLGGKPPLLEPDHLALIGADPRETDEAGRRFLAGLGVSFQEAPALAADPAAVARHALDVVAPRSGPLVVHFDVDVVDSGDLPLGNFPHYGSGVSLEQVASCLQVLLAHEAAAGLVLTEVNPTHDADGTLINGYLDALVGAIAGRLPKTAGVQKPVPSRSRFTVFSRAPGRAGMGVPGRVMMAAMALSTAFTELFSVQYPIALAPMGGSAGGALAAAVSNGGGLGLLGGGNGDPGWLARELPIVAAGTGKPWGVGFQSWAIDAGTVEHALQYKPRAVMLSFGDPRAFAGPIRQAGAALIIQATDLDEARQAVDLGADVIVAQGTEAGGHGARRGRSTLPFVPVVVDLAAPTPVLAAGGIADGRGVAAALALGAAGALIGTRFQATAEALADPSAKKAIVEGRGEHTERSTVLDIARGSRWPPEYPGRTLGHPFLDQWRGREDELAANADARQAYQDGVARGELPPIPVWASEAIDLINDLPPATDLVGALAAQAEDALARAGTR